MRVGTIVELPEYGYCIITDYNDEYFYGIILESLGNKGYVSRLMKLRDITKFKVLSDILC